MIIHKDKVCWSLWSQISDQHSFPNFKISVGTSGNTYNADTTEHVTETETYQKDMS